MLTNATDEILKLVNSEGKLPSYSWPGAYPLYYLDAHENTLCPDCANNNDEFDQPIVAYEANWEDPNMFCDHCGERIESAYAEDYIKGESDE